MLKHNRSRWKKGAVMPAVLAVSMLAAQAGGLAAVTHGERAAVLTVYDEGLSGEFADYSWAHADPANTEQAHGGSRSVKLDADEGQALYFYKDRVMNADEYEVLRFWVHGGAGGGQHFKLVLSLGGEPVAELGSRTVLPDGIPAGQWTPVEVKLADIGVTGLADGIFIWGQGAQEPFYLDDMSFSPKEAQPNPSPAVTPTAAPTATPAGTPTATPTAKPTATPTAAPTQSPPPAGPIEPVDGTYIFADALAEGFTDYSWGRHSLEESAWVHTGERSIRYTPEQDRLMYLYSDRILTVKDYEKLSFWVSGGAQGGQEVSLKWTAGGQTVAERKLSELLPEGIPSGQWAKAELKLADLNLPGQLFDGLQLAGLTAEPQSDIYLDDIALIAKQPVQAAVVEMRMDKNKVIMLPGEVQRLESESFLENGETAIVTGQSVWSSDHPEVAAVEGGRLTAVGLGVARITATYKGKTAEAYVQVTEAEAEPVYGDELAAGYRNLSWHDKDFANKTAVHGGRSSILFEPDGWDGVWIAGDGKKVSDYYGYELWLHGGTAGGQKLLFHAYDGGTSLGAIDLNKLLPEGGLPAGRWTKITVSFADLGIDAGDFDGLILQAGTEDNQGAVYIDDIALLRNRNPGKLPEPELPVIGVAIDRTADRRPVNPDIYGINYDDSHPTDSRLAFPVQRWGGNQTTRYNWELDVSNRASDWYFMNYPNTLPEGTALPHGTTTDRLIDQVSGQGGSVLLTVPTIGWTPKDRSIRYGFSQSKYGAQQSSPNELPDAGNGVYKNGEPVTGNDPEDTSKRIGTDFVTRWMDHIAARTGGAVNRYALDNEPEIWHVTHRDVHPEAPTYDELWNKTLEYGSAIKAKDPDAEIFGPVSWGWCAYFYSSADNCADGPDRQQHEGKPFLEWYLEQVRKHRDATKVRLVDYLDIHYYSQEWSVPSEDESPAAAKRRFQALKALYDPNFVDQSWIQEPIRLIPRMKEIIDSQLPGIKLAITEYNFGNGTGITAGLAQAEALAIFGREGVDLATRFGNFQAGTPIEDAFKLFLDYDGKGSKIEGTSVRTVSGLSDAVGAYTIEGRDGRLYVLLFNKDTLTRKADVDTGTSYAGPAQLYRFGKNTRLSPAGNPEAENGKLHLTLPARSATLVVVPAAP